VAFVTNLETATRIAREDPDEDPTGYATTTKVNAEDPDEAGWEAIAFGDPVAGALTF
jgi:hypothetical protein